MNCSLSNHFPNSNINISGYASKLLTIIYSQTKTYTFSILTAYLKYAEVRHAANNHEVIIEHRKEL